MVVVGRGRGGEGGGLAVTGSDRPVVGRWVVAGVTVPGRADGRPRASSAVVGRVPRCGSHGPGRGPR